jgi:hypothetical protein
MNQLSLHPHLQALFDLWSPETMSEAFAKPVPGEFFDQIFVAETTQNAPPVRISKAGQSLRELYGDAINGLDLLSVFSPQDRILVWTLMRTVSVRAQPGLLRLRALQPDGSVPVDLAITPLGGAGQRFLGFFQTAFALQREGLEFEVISVHPPQAHAPGSNG